jgi:hypothetical protein
MPVALALALLRAGSNMPAKMAMIAMTTKSSIKVKPAGRWWNRFGFDGNVGFMDS